MEVGGGRGAVSSAFKKNIHTHTHTGERVERGKMSQTKPTIQRSEQFGGGNVPGLNSHSWCSADDASASNAARAAASTTTGWSLGLGTAMTAVTHLVTCREKRGRLQAYLEGKNKTEM